jgi:hypothetical protein
MGHSTIILVLIVVDTNTMWGTYEAMTKTERGNILRSKLKGGTS